MGCGRTHKEEYVFGFQLYPMMNYLCRDGWMGMGDSLTVYPPDSVLYYGLKVDGKSFEEVCKQFGPPADTLLYELHYGMLYGENPFLYPLTYQKDSMIVKAASWIMPDNSSDSVIMTLYFELLGDRSKAFYGYQFDKNNMLELMRI